MPAQTRETIDAPQAGGDHQLLVAALNAVDERLILIDGRGCVLFANRGGKTFLRPPQFRRDRRRAGVSVTPRSTLMQVVRGVLDARRPRVLTGRQLAFGVATVTAMPLYPGEERCVVLLKLRGTSEPEASVSKLAGFSLTAAEASIASAVAAGETIARIATERRVTQATVRSQLKKVFAKLGCRRQVELAMIVRAASGS